MYIYIYIERERDGLNIGQHQGLNMYIIESKTRSSHLSFLGTPLSSL